jgi:hypothetical protein
MADLLLLSGLFECQTRAFQTLRIKHRESSVPQSPRLKRHE